MSLSFATQLQSFVTSNGPRLDIRGRVFSVAGISQDGDIAVATFQAAKTSYTGIRCNNTRVAGHPGAEVWSILANGKGREIASFAIADGRLRVLCR